MTGPRIDWNAVLDEQVAERQVKQERPPVFGTGLDEEPFALELLKAPGRIAKSFVNDLNVFESGITNRERLFRGLNVASFALPPIRVAKTAGLALRAAVRGAEAGGITAGLSLARGDDNVSLNALTGAGLGAGIETLLTKGRMRGRLSRSRDFDVNDLPTSLKNKSYAIVSAQLTESPKLLDEVNVTRHQELGKKLRDLGYDPIEVKGFGENQAKFEQVYLVPGMPETEAVELAQLFDQKYVLTDSGLIDIIGGTKSKVRKSETRFDVAVDPAEFHTEMPNGQRFALSLDPPIEINIKGYRALRSAEEKIDSLFAKNEKSFLDKIDYLPNAAKLHSWYIKTIRSFAEVERIEPLLGKATDQRLVRESPAKLAQMTSSWSAHAEHAMEYGIPKWDDRTKVVKRGFLQILSDLKSGDYDILNRYGAAKRMYHLATERGFKLPVLHTGQTLDETELLEVIQSVEAENPRVAAAFRELVDWRNEYMKQTLVGSGLLAEDVADGIIASTPDYIPLKRALDDLLETEKPFVESRVKVLSNPLKKFLGEGGEVSGNLQPWMEEMVRDTFVFSKLAHQQEFLGKLIDDFERNAPELVNTFAQRMDNLPGSELNQMQRELLQQLSQSDPGLALAAEKVGDDMLSLLAPSKLLAKGIIGGFKNHEGMLNRTTNEWLPIEQFDELVAQGGVVESPFGGQLLKSNTTDPVVSVGIKVDDQIFTGTDHGDAFNKAVDAGVITDPRGRGADFLKEHGSVGLDQQGFITKSGKFIPRQEFLTSKSSDFDPSNFVPANRPERVWYKITDDDLWQAVSIFNKPQMGFATSVMASIASILRAGATLSFEFMLRNPLRDVLFAKAATGAPIHDFIGGVASAIKKDEWFQFWLRSGGGRATFLSMDRDILKQEITKAMTSAEQGTGRKLSNVMLHPVQSLQALSDVLESGTRVGGFRRKYNELLGSMDPSDAAREAALFSRNMTTDFSVHGSKTSNLRVITAFWNAMLQGYDNIIRHAKSDPGGVALRLGAIVTVPSIATYLINRRDPEYFDLPEWERNLFWHIKAPENMPLVGDRWLRFPKPFDLGILFGSTVERFMEFIDKNDPKALDDLTFDYITKTLGDLVPLPTIARPLLELGMNTSLLRNRPIESRALADVEPAYRVQPGTSEISKRLAHWLDVSPIKLDHLYGGYTGSLGRMVSDMADYTIRLQDNLDNPETLIPSFDVRDIPGIRGMTSQYPTHSENVDQLYDLADKMRKAEQTRAYLERSMRIDELIDYSEEKGILLATYPAIKPAIDQLKQLREQRDLILNDRTMPPKQKRQLLDSFSYSMNMIAANLEPVVEQLENEQP